MFQAMQAHVSIQTPSILSDTDAVSQSRSGGIVSPGRMILHEPMDGRIGFIILSQYITGVHQQASTALGSMAGMSSVLFLFYAFSAAF